MRWLRWFVPATVLVCGGVLGAPSEPASAEPVSACSPSTGVLVVVDLRNFDGNITRGCAVSPASGYDALHDAGFSTVGTRSDGPGFVCRINGEPASDPCVRTPPANAYWSYWHADSGQSSWSYSQKGAQSSSPGDGSIDAWVFGATDIGGSRGGPSFTPAQVRSGTFTGPATLKPRPESKPMNSTAAHQSATKRPGDATTSPATRPVGESGSGTGSTGNTRVTVASHPSKTGAPSRTAGATPTAKSSSAPGTSSGASSEPVIVDATAVSAPTTKKGAGSALPVIGGLALVLLLGGGAGWTVLQRRRADADL